MPGEFFEPPGIFFLRGNFMKRFITLVAALFFSTLFVHAQDWAKTKLEKSPRHSEWVKVKHG